jgi:hypothetical protein
VSVIADFVNHRQTASDEQDFPLLLQLRVLRFGFLQDGDVGVGVFPEGEEILIRRFGLGDVAGDGISAGELPALCSHSHLDFHFPSFPPSANSTFALAFPLHPD